MMERGREVWAGSPQRVRAARAAICRCRAALKLKRLGFDTIDCIVRFCRQWLQAKLLRWCWLAVGRPARRRQRRLSSLQSLGPLPSRVRMRQCSAMRSWGSRAAVRGRGPVLGFQC